MSVLIAFVAAAVALSAVMAASWAVQRRTRNAGFADVFWSFGLGLFGASMALVPATGAEGGRQGLVAVLALIWGARLGSHILQRTLKGREDPRYARFREEWGGDFQRRLFAFLQMQAGAALVLMLPIFLAAHRPGPAGDIQDILGAVLLVVAIAGEAMADRQLAAFGRDPANRGKVCDQGLWAWSRHPNYFFQWLGWCAYAAIALDFSGDYLAGWLALIGPGLMYWLLVHVSGIPPLEAHMIRSRGPAFRAYQKRTSAFFPSPPQRKGTT